MSSPTPQRDLTTDPASTPAEAGRARKAQDYAFAGDWTGYFGVVRGKGPRETLLYALSKFEAQAPSDARTAPPLLPQPAHPPQPARLAIDLACGEGRDTLELLRRGWRVVAIEPEADGLKQLLDQVDETQALRLSAQIADFASARLIPCDLLNTSFALPFCPPHEFEALWRKITNAIQPGGRFAGQFFGDRDSWVTCGRTLGHSRSQIDRLFEGFNLERLEEDEKDDLGGETPKHWHVFHIVARRR